MSIRSHDDSLMVEPGRRSPRRGHWRRIGPGKGHRSWASRHASLWSLCRQHHGRPTV